MLLGFDPVPLLHQPEKDSLSHRTFNCMELVLTILNSSYSYMLAVCMRRKKARLNLNPNQC